MIQRTEVKTPPLTHLTEAHLLREITYYEREAHQAQPGLGAIYRAVLDCRRRLLAALRAGRPEAWIDFPG